MTDRISATPDPVGHGKTVRICYNFDGATSPVTLKLDYDPSSVPDESITLSSDTPCKDVTVPAAAMGILVIDKSGQSSDHAITVT